jgi:predicted dithiol-disulfide oxidoreductase (DUF899 family)
MVPQLHAATSNDRSAASDASLWRIRCPLLIYLATANQRVLSKQRRYHTYSTYARGLDALWGMYQWLDRAPLGRNEAGVWWRRHDEYDRR